MKKIVLLLVSAIAFSPVGAQQPSCTQGDAPVFAVTNSATGKSILLQGDCTPPQASAPQPPRASDEPSSLPAGQSASLEQITDTRVVLVYVDSFQCSGAMVGPYTVLTAAHCLLDEDGKLTDASKIKVYAGGKPSRFVAKADYYYYASIIQMPHALEGGNFRNRVLPEDLSIIVLDKPLGEKVGYFGVWNPPLVVGLPIEIRGFPGHQNKEKPWLSRGFITGKNPPPGSPGLDGIIHYGTIVHTAAFSHNAFMQPGSSGAPVFVKGHPGHIIAVGAGGSWLLEFASRGLLSAFVEKYKGARPRAAHANISRQLSRELKRKHR